MGRRESINTSYGLKNKLFYSSFCGCHPQTCGITPLVSGLHESLRGVAEENETPTRGAQINDTAELAKMERHMWPVTCSRSVVRIGTRPMTG